MVKIVHKRKSDNRHYKANLDQVECGRSNYYFTHGSYISCYLTYTGFGVLFSKWYAKVGYFPIAFWLYKRQYDHEILRSLTQLCDEWETLNPYHRAQEVLTNLWRIVFTRMFVHIRMKIESCKDHHCDDKQAKTVLVIQKPR